MARNQEGEFEVTWEADDGYVGASRPHSFHISPDDIEKDMSDADLGKLLDDEIQNDFEQEVNPYAKNRDEFIAWAKAVQEKMED
jgi:hypothetical protein